MTTVHSKENVLMKTQKIKIAFLGLRGIPAQYGGYETFVEEIGGRLVKLGFDVTVYCRKGAVPEMSFYKGMRLIQLPTLPGKYFQTVFHSFLSTLHVLFSDRHILYYCNTINSLYCLFPRLIGKKTIVNTDGLEWKRKKWGRIGRAAYRISEWISTWAATGIVCDSKEMAAYYLRKYRKRSEQIGYGGSGLRSEDVTTLKAKYGLEPGKYFLYVSRMEPENNAHLFVKAYERVKTEMPFIVVGDAPFAKQYLRELKATRDPRIRFLGYVFGEDYRMLTSHAFVYFHGNEVGGTNPGLVEAMSLGNCVLAIDVPFNREVLGDAGFFFKAENGEELKTMIERLLIDKQNVTRARSLACERALRLYDWGRIALQYKDFFGRLVSHVGKENL